ncbi:hypothetical protein BH09ACT3_BH09ACT3_04510 [soil metagenome]
MTRVYLIGGVVALAFIVYAVIDCALAYRHRVRALPKPLWILLILILPIIGAILWFTVGKDRGRGVPPSGAQAAPDDDPVFLRRLAADAEREERIRQLEEQLNQLDDDQPDRKRPDRPDAKD